MSNYRQIESNHVQIIFESLDFSLANLSKSSILSRMLQVMPERFKCTRAVVIRKFITNLIQLPVF